MRRWIVRTILILFVGAAVWAGWKGLDRWRASGELLIARREIDRGRYETARRRLSALSTARPGALGGQVDYWLGICESQLGRFDHALTAFSRVPSSLVFEPRASYLEAEANLRRGRLRPAERRLVDALSRGGDGLNELRRLLSRIYEIQLRVEDALPVYRQSLDETTDPFPILQRINSLDGGTLPLESLRATLDEAAGMAPEDDRIWLGRARMAIVSGQWVEAEDWLNRCRKAGADAAVWRAVLLWSRQTGRLTEALEAMKAIGEAQFNRAERQEIRAWMCRETGDAEAEWLALSRWLELESHSIPALDRAATLATTLGKTAEAASLRQRKSQADAALDRYRQRVRMGHAGDFQTSDSLLEVARLAESSGRSLDAMAWYSLALKQTPGDTQARDGVDRIDRERRGVQLSGSEDLGLIAELTKLATRETREPRSRINVSDQTLFVDRAGDVGLKFEFENGESLIHQIPETTSGGVGLIDYNGDGWLDVFVVQGGTFPPAAGSSPTGDRLFRNRGDGTFEDATKASGISAIPGGYGHGVTVADYDNDGRPDLFLTRWRSYVLLRNRSDGTFEDVTARSGLDGDRDWPTSAAFADLDGDGDLDLFVCHYGVWDAENPRLCRDEASGVYIACNPLELQARPDHVFRNDNGRFVDVSEAWGLADHDGRGLGVLATDLDDDGKIDLYVANDLTANHLWKNHGDERLEEIGHAAGVAGNASGGYQASMGIAAGDCDGDGRLDLAVTNFYGECTTLYRNLGGGIFCDGTAASGVDVATRQLLGFGICFLDANNDGLLDLASANGHVNDLRPHFPYLMPAQLLLGLEGGRFIDASSHRGDVWSVPRMGRALASGDLDNDGRVDLILVGHRQPLAYLHNQSNAGHFLTLRLQGAAPASNRDAIGARVIVEAGGRKWTSWRTGGGSFQSSSDDRLHFGLGSVDRVDTIEVTWPSGRIDHYSAIQADTGYVLREGQTQTEPLKGYSARPQ